jgi:hypothetical protein
VLYFLSFAVILIIIISDMMAIHRNRVSASAGEFFPIFCTTSRSENMDNAAVRTSLGGREHVPGEPKELKVAFGELPSKGNAGADSRTVRRAGFGQP